MKIQIHQNAIREAKKRNPDLLPFGVAHLVNTLLCRQLNLPEPVTPNEAKRLAALKREATRRAKVKREAKAQSEFEDAEKRGQVRLFALKPTKRSKKNEKA